LDDLLSSQISPLIKIGNNDLGSAKEELSVDKSKIEEPKSYVIVLKGNNNQSNKVRNKVKYQQSIEKTSHTNNRKGDEHQLKQNQISPTGRDGARNQQNTELPRVRKQSNPSPSK